MARMTDFYTQLRLMAPLLVALGMASCSSTPKIEGLPGNLPEIDLHGSAATPPHNMSSGHAEESSEPVSRRSKKSSGRSRVVEDSPPEPAARSSTSSASRSRGEDITPSHRGGAPKPKLVTKSKSDGTASKKSSADDDSPKPKKKTGSTSDSSKPKKKATSTSDSPKPKKKSDSSSDSPKPKKKTGSTSDSPKPKKKKPSSEN